MNGLTRRTIILAALVFALGATTLVYLLNKAQAIKAQQGGEQVPAVVAEVNLPPRTVIEPGQIRVTTKPYGWLDKDAAVSADEVVGRVAVAAIAAGDTILRSQVAAKNPSLGLAFAVPPGMRAVTVAIDPIIGVAGFLQPGNHVDVIATFTEDKASVTKTVLQDVELLATGRQVQEQQVEVQGKTESRPQEVPNATLAVTPQDAEKLILAESKGKLRLALRPVGDTEFADVTGITSRTLVGRIPQPEQPRSAAAAPARVVYRPPAFSPFMTAPAPRSRLLSPERVQPVTPVAQHTVELYRGTDKEVVNVAE